MKRFWAFVSCIPKKLAKSTDNRCILTDISAASCEPKPNPWKKELNDTEPFFKIVVDLPIESESAVNSASTVLAREPKLLSKLLFTVSKSADTLSPCQL